MGAPQSCQLVNVTTIWANTIITPCRRATARILGKALESLRATTHNANGGQQTTKVFMGLRQNDEMGGSINTTPVSGAPQRMTRGMHVSIRVMQWVKKSSLHALFDFATRVHTACLTAGVGCSSAWHFSLGKSAGTHPLAQPET